MSGSTQTWAKCLYFAQPYDISAKGFYFSDYDTYLARSAALRNAHGWPVEEFEIQFIDGDRLDDELFDALSVTQANLVSYLNHVDDWDDATKIAIIIAVGELGHQFDPADTPEFDFDVYAATTLRALAEQFVDEGLFGDIPDAIAPYLDYDAIARDLAMDYAEITIDGTDYVYRGG